MKKVPRLVSNPRSPAKQPASHCAGRKRARRVCQSRGQYQLLVSSGVASTITPCRTSENCWKSSELAARLMISLSLVREWVVPSQLKAGYLLVPRKGLTLQKRNSPRSSASCVPSTRGPGPFSMLSLRQNANRRALPFPSLVAASREACPGRAHYCNFEPGRASCPMRKASAKRGRLFAHESSGRFAGVTAKHLRDCLYRSVCRSLGGA